MPISRAFQCGATCGAAAREMDLRKRVSARAPQGFDTKDTKDAKHTKTPS